MMLELKDFQLSGNVVHTAWFKTITKDNGKAYLLAINILADIVYWYKPTEIRDEITGNCIGWRNKYKADLLQKSYKSLSIQFGMSTGQIKEAVLKLEELGVIERVFRDIKTDESILFNVMFIKLNFDKLKEISIAPDCIEPPSKKRPTPIEKKIGGSEKKDTPIGENNIGVGGNSDTPLSEKPQTNTEITTKTTTSTTTDTQSCSDEQVSATENKRNQVPYQQIIDEFNKICISLPQVTTLTDKRKKAIAKVYKQQGCNTDVLNKLFHLVEQNDFLTGRLQGKDWRTSFDWIMRIDKVVAILEGQYSGGVGNKSNSNSNNKFTNMYSHNWNFEELAALEEQYIDRKLAGDE